MDLTEAEDIKKRWQEYTEELYKKDLHDQDNHDGMTTHLEPDILEYMGDSGSTPLPEVGMIPWRRNGYPLQCSYLKSSMDRGVWQATVHGIVKSWT